MPKLVEDECRLSTSISAYGNSLALFQVEYSMQCLNIWLMKEYGDASSWTKIEILADSGLPPKPKAFRKGGEIRLEMNYGKIVSRDLETQEIKDLRIVGNCHTFVDSYVESIVLLDKPTVHLRREENVGTTTGKEEFIMVLTFMFLALMAPVFIALKPEDSRL